MSLVVAAQNKHEASMYALDISTALIFGYWKRLVGSQQTQAKGYVLHLGPMCAVFPLAKGENGIATVREKDGA